MRPAVLPCLLLAIAACSGNAPDPGKDRIAARDRVDHPLDLRRQDPRCAGTPDSAHDTGYEVEHGILPPGYGPLRGPRPWADKGIVANARLARLLSAEILHSQYPDVPNPKLVAALKRGVWFVDSLPPRAGQDWAGGGLHLELCQSNGRILNLMSSQ